jgi:hypothetical protein
MRPEPFQTNDTPNIEHLKPAEIAKQGAQRKRTRRKAAHKTARPTEVLRALGGWCGGSIGQAEALAGVNVQSQAERVALWGQFRHLFSGDSQTLINAVMDHCAEITLARIERGELSLLPTRF